MQYTSTVVPRLAAAGQQFVAQPRQAAALRVDVNSVLRERVPGLYRWMPRFVVRWLERYICQEQMNEVLQATAGRKGSSFCAGVLDYLDAAYTLEGEENLPAPEQTNVIYVSNHPLGALDGICLIDMVRRRHGVEPHFVVNDLLSVLKPLDNVFIPINKHGRQSRDAVKEVDAAFADLRRPVIMFPAGLCSRQQKGQPVRDLEWNKMFVQKSADAGRTVVPVRFEGENSKGFYRLARLRQRLGIKFNLEMIRLPREIFLNRGARFAIKAGCQIGPEELERGPRAAECAAGIRQRVYEL